MVRTGDDSADRERAFGLTFPEKRTFEFRRAYKRRRLITYINQIRRNHPHWERDRDRVAFGNFTARRFDNDAARIGLGVRCFFLLIFVRARRGELTEDDRTRCKQAKRYRDWTLHSCYGPSSRIRRRSASASLIFPIRRSHCSRSLSARSDSLICSERVCD